jgi:hypothetical protein
MSTDQVPASPDNGELVRVVDVWKYIVSVQMHFNDMEMKIRNLYFTILAAAMGLIGIVQGKRIHIEVPEVSISVSLIVIIVLIPVSMLFYFMDRHWYHRLLQGAVAQCIKIESKYASYLPEIQLGSQISEASPVEFPGTIWKVVFRFVGDKRFWSDGNIHSDAKIEILYKSVIWGCVSIFVIYGFAAGVRFRDSSLLGLVMHYL